MPNNNGCEESALLSANFVPANVIMETRGDRVSEAHQDIGRIVLSLTG
jgi:hypothetical protein